MTTTTVRMSEKRAPRLRPRDRGSVRLAIHASTTGRLANGSWRTATQGDGKGWPDLVLVRDRVLYVELKSATGRLSEDQSEWLLALEKAHVEVHVWRPEQWTDGTIESVLRRVA